MAEPIMAEPPDSGFSPGSSLEFCQKSEPTYSRDRSSYVLVMEGDKLVGLFTERDALDLAASGCNLEWPIEQVMTQPVITLKQSEFQDMFVALSRLRQHRIRHLPVIDDNGNLVGAITCESMLHGGVAEHFLEWQNAFVEQQVRERTAQMRSHHQSLMELVKHKIASSANIEAALQQITEVAARTLAVKRASVWLYNQDRSGIRCLDLYESDKQRHSQGIELTKVRYPAYFRALKSERAIAAEDARQDSRTAEFSADYLTPCGIASMLDAPIWLDGEMVGVVCHEHEEKRQWTTDEINFAGSIADIASLAMEAQNRKRAEAALQKANQELEVRVEARTAALQKTAEQLQDKITQLQKAEEALRYRVELEKLIATISTQFINLPPSEIEDGINQALQAVGEKMGVERSYIVLFFAEENKSDKIYQWLAPGSQSLTNMFQELSVTTFKWIMERFDKLDTICLCRAIEELPSEAQAERKLIVARGIKSLVWIPLAGGGETIGFLGLDCLRMPKAWSGEAIALLKTVGEIFVGAIQRQQAQEALLVSQERFALAVEGASDGIWDWDIRTGTAYLSPRWKSMLGYAELEIANSFEAWSDRLHPEDRAQTFEALNEHLEGKTPIYEQEFRLLHKDGTYRWILARGKALRDKEGKPYRMAGSHTNITDRKKAQEALQLTQFSVDRTADAVFWMDSDAHLLYVNQAACQSLGYSREELLAMRVWDVDPDVSPEFWLAHWRELQQAGSLKLESRHRTKHGSIFPVEVSANYLEFNGKAYNCAIVRDISDRVSAEQEKTELIRYLQESQHFIQQIADTNPNILYIYDLVEGRNIYSNRQVGFILGYTPTEIKKMGERFLPQFLHPDDAKRVGEYHARLAKVQDDEIFDIEYRLRHANGSWRWLSSRETVFSRTPEGLTKQILGTATDITDRKQAEEALRASEERLRTVVANTPIMLYALDSQGNFVLSEGKGLESLGLKPNEIVGESVIDLYRRQPEILEQICRVFAGEDRAWIEEVGGFIYDHQATPLRDNSGQAIGLIGVATDITNRVLAERALRESEERFRLVADSAPVMLWMTDVNARCTFLNQSWLNFTGRSWQEELGSAWLDSIHPEDRDRYLDSYLSAVAACQGFKIEYRMRHANGEYRWILDTGVPRFLTADSLEEDKNEGQKEGEFAGYIGSCVDINHRFQAEQDMRYALAKEKELSELKSRFISITSHEFRTPLMTILFSAGLLENYGRRWDEEKKNKHIDRIQSAVNQMMELLEDLLLIGKAEAGQLEFKPAPLDLEKFCQNLVEEIQQGLGATHQIVFSSKGNRLSANMDEKLLRHIFSNLLSNGVKYSPPSSTVQLTLVCERGQAIFQVRDRGIGIPPEDQEGLFELFHRASNVGTIPGSGLGLAIVKRSVEVHGGRIAADSSVGRGTTFTVTLPLYNSLLGEAEPVTLK